MESPINFSELMEKYSAVKSAKERRLIKRKVHSGGYGSAYGTLVAHGRLDETVATNPNAPKWSGEIEDIDTGKSYRAAVWDNNGSIRIELSKQHLPG
jgi:hypothetical protein